jgi:hypothetical protein
MYPTIQELHFISIPPEKYVEACDLSQLYELEIHLYKKIKKLEADIQSQDSEKDNYLDLANKKHQIILKQI